MATVSQDGQAPVCVTCRTRAVDPRWRPFCSRRCQLEDLSRWADGRYRVGGDPVVKEQDDDFSSLTD